MLRPFEHGSDSDYLLAVANELKPVVGAFAAVCGMRNPAGNVKIVSSDWPDSKVAAFAEFMLNDVGTQRASGLGTEIVSQRAVVRDH